MAEARYYLFRYGRSIFYESVEGKLEGFHLPAWWRHPLLRAWAEWVYRRDRDSWPRRPAGWG